MGNLSLRPPDRIEYTNLIDPIDSKKVTNLSTITNLRSAQDGAYFDQREGETRTFSLNTQYFSEETINEVGDGLTNADSQIKKIPTGRYHDHPYYKCDGTSNTNNCADLLTKTDSILYDSNNNKKDINQDPVLYTDKYNKLKYLDNEIHVTQNMAREYYILLYVWFIIMIIILFVFMITLLSNNSEISSTTYYIVLIFFLYCCFYIYKNISN
jgi:hypothetical protein